MQDADKPQFWEMLAKEMARYGKPMPEAAISREWWELLQPFPLAVISAAFLQYRRLESRFHPIPASIENLCLQCDGRPGGDEAWATAMRATDEHKTVVWTDETQQAFWDANSLLEARDVVGGRKSFLQAYDRLVAEARAIRKPVHWNITPGRNAEQHAIEYKRAIEMGRLPAPDGENGPGILALLPDESARTPKEPAQLGFDGEATDNVRVGLAMIKEAVSKMQTPAEKLQRFRERLSQEERCRTAELKRAAAELAAQHGVVQDIPAPPELRESPVSSEHRTGPYHKGIKTTPQKTTGGKNGK